MHRFITSNGLYSLGGLLLVCCLSLPLRAATSDTRPLLNSLSQGPIVNALGLDLGQSVDESLLRERYSVAPDFVIYQPDKLRVAEDWYSFRAGTKPKVLQNLPLQLATQVDANNRVLRVDSAFPGACRPLGQTILDILATKYVAPRPGADAWQLIDSGEHQIAWHCGNGFVHLSYLHLPSIEAAQTASKRDEDATAAEHVALQEARARQVADRITLGSRGHLTGGMGIAFDRSAGEFQADTLVTLATPTAHPFDAQIDLKVGPDGRPYQIYGHIKDAQAPVLFSQFDTALQTKYGSPHSGSPKRRIFRVNGDLIRLTHKSAELTLLFINQSGAIAARGRAKQLADAKAAKKAQEFDAETQGL